MVFLKNGLISLIVAALAVWLLIHGCKTYRIKAAADDLSGVLSEKDLPRFPQVPYRLGRQAFYTNADQTAETYFKMAVSGDIFFINAWLRLAETLKTTGHRARAQEILAFTSRYTEKVIRWKWRQMLLARELGMNPLFLQNANRLLDQPGRRQDTFQLLDTHFQGDTSAVLGMLAPAHRAAYLDWLMRWDRVDDTRIVWKTIATSDRPDLLSATRYVHFLLGHKRIQAAAAIWQERTGIRGMTNPGFEEKITGTGFDWRYTAARPGKWKIQRVGSPVHGGSYALKIVFEGRENLSFHHLYQIVPVTPHTSFQLTYAWKSQDVTTDQGPFIEIYGDGCKGWYQKGKMMQGTRGWQEERIDLIPPEGCRAVVIRLRRLPSKRFDSLISGTVWLDDFRLGVR